jgi:hypothetical protein
MVNDFSSIFIKIEFATVVPPIMDVDEDELQWLDYDIEESPQWTPMTRYFEVSLKDIQSLIAAAQVSTLSVSQINQIIFGIKENPAFIESLELNSDKVSLANPIDS